MAQSYGLVGLTEPSHEGCIVDTSHGHTHSFSNEWNGMYAASFLNSIYFCGRQSGLLTSES